MVNKPGRRIVYYLVAGLSLLLLFAFLGRCSPSPNKPWEIDELRALDPLDAPDPTLDLIAVYTRDLGFEKQIRLDFLDLPETPAADISIALDTKPGGSESMHLSRLELEALYTEGIRPTEIAYDLLLVIPAEGEPGVVDIAQSTLSTSIKPKIFRDPTLDMLTVSFNYFDLPPDYSLQVFVTPAGEHSSADQTSAIASDAVPHQRAPLLMAFSQTFPATTPAQTLRRWDGAHTGPYGERHGLNPLLDAAAASHIPLVLLDLKTPAGLSALDLTGGVDEVKKMWRDKLLILPDVVYGEPVDVSLTHSMDTAKAFGLPVGKFIFSPGSVDDGYALKFFNNPQASSPVSIVEWNGQNLLGIPSAVEEQTTPDGLTLEARRALVNAAFETRKDRVVVFGGGLPDSSWGDSDAGPAGMRYIAAHPWIQPLDVDVLMNITPTVVQTDPRLAQSNATEPVAIYNTQGQPTGFDSETLKAEILSRLESAPENALTDSAWEMYFLLAAPVNDPKLAKLNAQYLGDINILLTAADWAQSPASQSTCSVDLNSDLLPDCVLADDQYFAVFETDGARLAYLFSYDENGIHQITAPGWQFSTGLSDRTEWQPNLGHAADPSQIPGAFYDSDSPWRVYTPLLGNGGNVIFTSAKGMTKTYLLMEDGIQLEYQGAPLAMKAGLAVAPWRRFEPGWGKKYHAKVESNTLSWRLDGGPSVQINAPDGKIYAFNDTLQYLGELENPNQAFPPGHYLPFPMAVIEFQAAEGYQILFQIK